MFTLKNDSVLSSWNVDLEDYNETESFLPLNSFNLRNDSSQIAYVSLDGRKVGEVQRYSSDSFMGRPFSIFTVYNPDYQDFAINDLFVQVSKDQVMSSQPYNPQWDMLEDDFDRYVTGCDSRISFSSTITAEIIKYWLNVQNQLIVQRKLDILGGAAVGSYEIDYGGGDIIAGSTAIDFPTVDPKRYRKTILDSALDYTLTNCSIKGWMIDYLLNPNDISSGYTVIEGGADVGNVYDDNMTTNAYYTHNNTTYELEIELSFASADIKELHSYLTLDASAGPGSNCRIQLYSDGAWITVTTNNTTDANLKAFYNHETTGWDNCTGLRVHLKCNSLSTAYLRVYDITALHV